MLTNVPSPHLDHHLPPSHVYPAVETSQISHSSNSDTKKLSPGTRHQTGHQTPSPCEVTGWVLEPDHVMQLQEKSDSPLLLSADSRPKYVLKTQIVNLYYYHGSHHAIVLFLMSIKLCPLDKHSVFSLQPSSSVCTRSPWYRSRRPRSRKSWGSTSSLWATRGWR